MRILHVSDVYAPRLGGIEVLVADLAGQQRSRGHRVRVLTSTPAGPDDDPGGQPDVVRLPRSLDARVARLIRAERPDVVHCHSSVLSPLAWRGARAAAAAGVPALITMHSLTPTGGLGAAALGGRLRMVPPTVRWSAVSRVAADALAPLVRADVLVLPNGVDLDACRPAEPARTTAGPAHLVSVMRMAHRKRPLPLIDVLARLSRTTPPESWRATVIGDGPLLGAAARAVRRAGLGDRIVLTGRLTREQTLAAVASADLYLAPAHRESFGIAALEARCSGVPVVAMRAGGVGEFVAHGAHGFLVADDAELARRARQLVLDRVACAELARRCRADRPDLGWPSVVDRVLAAYELAGVRPVAAALR